MSLQEALNETPAKRLLTPQGFPYRRGIAPDRLLAQVDNTALFAQDLTGIPYLENLAKARRKVGLGLEFDEYEYFELCISAHFTTVATFVPTDVDNQIRLKLWQSPLADEEGLLRMARLVLQAQTWDTRPLSKRWIVAPNGWVVSGHSGEWLGLAVAAHQVVRRFDVELTELLFNAIEKELSEELLAFDAFVKNKDGMAVSKVTAIVSHNFGDMLRVVDLWKEGRADSLRDLHQWFAKTPAFLIATEVYKELLASENHRHLCLRLPRGLRRSADLLLPIGPFYDEWGKTVAQHPALEDSDRGEIAEALIDGYRKTQTLGYARALHSLEENFKGGLPAIAAHLPSRIEKEWRTGKLRALCDVSQSHFEGHWAQRVLKKVASVKT